MSRPAGGAGLSREPRATSSSQKVDLRTVVVPPSIWEPQQRCKATSAENEGQALGFVRVFPDVTLAALRLEIQSQMESSSIPPSYIFLKHVGNYLATVSAKQEARLTVKSFIPPMSTAPEIYLLPLDGLSHLPAFSDVDAVSSLSSLSNWQSGSVSRAQTLLDMENARASPTALLTRPPHQPLLHRASPGSERRSGHGQALTYVSDLGKTTVRNPGKTLEGLENGSSPLQQKHTGRGVGPGGASTKQGGYSEIWQAHQTAALQRQADLASSSHASLPSVPARVLNTDASANGVFPQHASSVQDEPEDNQIYESSSVFSFPPGTNPGMLIHEGGYGTMEKEPGAPLRSTAAPSYIQDHLQHPQQDIAASGPFQPHPPTSPRSLAMHPARSPRISPRQSPLPPQPSEVATSASSQISSSESSSASSSKTDPSVSPLPPIGQWAQPSPVHVVLSHGGGNVALQLHNHPAAIPVSPRQPTLSPPQVDIHISSPTPQPPLIQDDQIHMLANRKSPLPPVQSSSASIPNAPQQHTSPYQSSTMQQTGDIDGPSEVRSFQDGGQMHLQSQHPDSRQVDSATAHHQQVPNAIAGDTQTEPITGGSSTAHENSTTITIQTSQARHNDTSSSLLKSGGVFASREAAMRQQQLEMEQLQSELQAVREESEQLTQRQKTLRKSVASTQAAGDGDWKKLYQQEKSRTKTLEQDCDQLKQDLKITGQRASSRVPPGQKGAGSKDRFGLGGEKPSTTNNFRIMCYRLEEELNVLRARKDETEARFQKEQKAMKDMQQQCKLLREELTDKKITRSLLQKNQ